MASAPIFQCFNFWFRCICNLNIWTCLRGLHGFFWHRASRKLKKAQRATLFTGNKLSPFSFSQFHCTMEFPWRRILPITLAQPFVLCWKKTSMLLPSTTSTEIWMASSPQCCVSLEILLWLLVWKHVPPCIVSTKLDKQYAHKLVCYRGFVQIPLV